MSLLREIGAAIGVGNLSVAVECDSACHHGEQVQGAAILTGGKVPQTVEGLRLGLALRWQGYDQETKQNVEHHKVLHQRSMPVQIQVLPGNIYRAPFTLDIPAGATLAEPGEWHTIDVTADIPGAVDVTGHGSVFLWPIRPIADTLRALVSATGWALQGFRPRKARAGFVLAVLVPAPALAKRFDRINIELALAQGRMRVFVTLDMKEGIWKTLTGGDEHHYEFEANDLPGLVASVQGLIHKHAQDS